MKKIIVIEQNGLTKTYFSEDDQSIISKLSVMGHGENCDVQVHDLDKDYDWKLSECHKKRVSEYPPIGDQLDAIMKFALGDSSELTAIAKKCDDVKKKYPKPAKG